MKTQVIFVIVFLLLMNIALANILITYNQEHTVVLTQEKEFNITINNNDTIDIFNIDFSPVIYLTFPKKFNLTKNTTINKTIKIRTTETFSQQSFASIFSFNTITEGIREPETRELSLTRTSISDNNLDIFKMDTVRFHNNDTINLTIKDNLSVLIAIIEPNTFHDKQYTEVKEIGYVIEKYGFVGGINIKDNTIGQFVHNPSTDQSLPFRITSTNFPSSFNLTNLLPNPIMQYNGTLERVLLLQSTSAVFDVNLSASKWITFQENNFDFSGSKLINFDIKPEINSTDQTAIVHSITITAKTENAATQTIEVNVFIVKHNFSEFKISKNRTIIFLPPDEDIIDAYCKIRPKTCLTDGVVEAYCKANPDVCPKQIVLKNRTLTTEGQTLEDIKNNQERALNKLVGIEQEKLPAIVTSQENINSRIGEIENRQSRLEKEKEEEDKKKTRGTVWKWVINTILILGIGGTLLFYYGRNWLENKWEMS